MDDLRAAAVETLRGWIRERIGDRYYLDPDEFGATTAADWLIGLDSRVVGIADIGAR